MKNESVIQRNPLLRWLIQPSRIPLLFSVTVVAGIFYHYAANLTLLWILLSLLIQTGLFRLFDFVKKRPLIGGVLYILTGIAVLALAVAFILLGRRTPFWAPADSSLQIDFMVWFLTPQSVLAAKYMGYTVGLFLLFTMFIATTAYYFTMVRYRVLMSFVVMIFPFAIYAKENETMPVVSILILLTCYFAVMIYCRQAHAEDCEVVQRYVPDTVSRLQTPSRKSPYANIKPEILDGRFLKAVGIFLSAATILILVIPKPEVRADRTYLETMLDFSAFTDFLEQAISGFADSSDGGRYSGLNYSRALYYANAREPLNLRIRTMTNYNYDKDEWFASEYDQKPDTQDLSFILQDGFLTMAETADPAEVVQTVHQIASDNPEFAKRWGLEALAALPAEDYSDLYYPLEVGAPRLNTVYPAPLHVRKFDCLAVDNQTPLTGFISRNAVLFSQQAFTVYNESYQLEYLSESFKHRPAAITLMQAVNSENWHSLLADALDYIPAGGGAQSAIIINAYAADSNARSYANSVKSRTPDSVRQLAMQLTEGLESDYEKATAISDYLRISGNFTYSLDFPITDADNVETFLFKNKTGVCYQFASAMTELSRAAGLPVRYVEGYAMNEPDKRAIGGADFVISTDDAHAFVDVFISGYGWMMFDATAAMTEAAAGSRSSVLSALQYSGVILFAIALAVILLTRLIIPRVRERLFRRWYQKHRDAEGVQAAFLRLRKQWHADPAETARELCEKQSAFLQMDLNVLLAAFEQAVYAGRCDEQTADAVFRSYCAACDAWKPALKRQRKAEKQARRTRAASAGAS